MPSARIRLVLPMTQASGLPRTRPFLRTCRRGTEPVSTAVLLKELPRVCPSSGFARKCKSEGSLLRAEEDPALCANRRPPKGGESLAPAPSTRGGSISSRGHSYANDQPAAPPAPRASRGRPGRRRADSPPRRAGDGHRAPLLGHARGRRGRLPARDRDPAHASAQHRRGRARAVAQDRREARGVRPPPPARAARHADRRRGDRAAGRSGAPGRRSWPSAATGCAWGPRRCGGSSRTRCAR